MAAINESIGGIIRIRDLPGVQKIEDRLLLYERNENLSAETEALIDQFSKKVFGIGCTDLNYPWPADFENLSEMDRWPIEEEADGYRASFETFGLSDELAMKLLLSYNIDFSNNSNQPLLCTSHLMRQAEVAAKGIAGHLPSAAEVNAANWGANLETEVLKFRAGKKHGL